MSGRRTCREIPVMFSTASTRLGGTLSHCKTADGVMRSCLASALADPTASKTVSMTDCVPIHFYKHNSKIIASESAMEFVISAALDKHMAKSERSMKIGAAIRLARKRRGYVMRHVAEHLGTDVAAVGNWESGRNSPSMENLVKTAEFLSIDPTALSHGEAVFIDDQETLSEAEIVTDMVRPPTGPQDVEVLGVAVGGDDGDFQFNGEVVGYVRRPPGITSLRKVFALYVLSDSMSPRYEPGEMIYCGGRDPVPGDHVVIEMFPEEEGTVGKAFIKKLVKRSTAEVIVEQYNPRTTLTFDRYAVKQVWRVIPLAELVGY